MSTKIETKTGNLLHVTTGHIVHGCNAQGVMGSGVALAVKQTWPHVFEAYRKEYEANGLVLGRAYPIAATPKITVWNAITQNLYGKGTRMVSYDAVQTCFQAVNDWIELYQSSVMAPAEVHIPFIGAGLGGGSWNIIKSIIEDTMDYPITAWSIDGKDPYGKSIDFTS